MLVSVCKTTSPNDWEHNFFVTLDVHRVNDLIKIITTKVWSAFTWENGKRCGAGFVRASGIVLDVDDGPSITETIDRLSAERVAYLIGTTKSHGIEKGDKPPCDRYRVLIPIAADDPYAADSFQVRQNIMRLIGLYKSDPAAKDLARKWMPCRRVVACEMTRTPYRLKEFQAVETRKIEGRNFMLPRWLAAKIEEPIASNRNHAIHSLACAMFEYTTRSYEQVESMFMHNVKIIGRESFSDTEIRQAVRSAYRKITGN